MTLKFSFPFEGLATGLSAGDLAPNWPLATPQGAEFSFLRDDTAGNTLVVLVVGSASPDTAALPQFDGECERLSAIGVRTFVVFADAAAAGAHSTARFRALVDLRGELTASLGMGPHAVKLVVLRANHHIAAIEDVKGDAKNGAKDGARAFAGVHALCERLQTARATRAMSSHPPVLMVPDVFSRDECRQLIEVFNTRGQIMLPSGPAHNHLGADYKMQVAEHMREDRVDHFFFEKPTLHVVLKRLLRVEAEVARAFHYRITKHETLRIARYQGTRVGYGHGHRDNSKPAYAHRRFALSINLNTDEFEGGELRFPEFGDQRYRPETGSAFVFSSSLRHEALQVTRGTRYVLLSFMFGET